MDILEYIKQMQEMYGEDVITTADKLERPPKALELQMFQDFDIRNPKANGGQLVAPSVDGSRPGYAGDPVEANIRLTPTGNAYEVAVQRGPQVFNKTFRKENYKNASEALKAARKFRDQKRKIPFKTGIQEPIYGSGLDQREYMRRYNLANPRILTKSGKLAKERETKLKNFLSKKKKIKASVLRDFILDDIGYENYDANKIKKKFPNLEIIKDIKQGTDFKPLNKKQKTIILDNFDLPEGVKDWNFKQHKFGFSSDKHPRLYAQIKSRLGDKQKYTIAANFSGPEGWMMGSMNRLYENELKNKVKYADLTYQPIKNKKGIIVGFKDNTAAGKGNIYYGTKKAFNEYGDGTEWRLHGDFNKVSKFIKIADGVKEKPDKVLQKILDDKGITKLLEGKRNLTLNDVLSHQRYYSTLAKTSPTELIKRQIVIHHTKGVGDQNLLRAAATKDIQLLTGAVNSDIIKLENIVKGTPNNPARALTIKEKAQLKNYGAKILDFDGKVVGGGFIDPEKQFAAIEKGALKYAKGKDFNVKTVTSYLERLGCGKAAGGRILMSNGGATLTKCARKGSKKLEQILLKGGANKNEQILANSILKSGRFLKDAVSLRGLFGPVALAFTAAAEAGMVGYDMLSKGKTFKEAVGDNFFNYALGPKLKIDSIEERNKRLRGIGGGPPSQAFRAMSEKEMGKIAAYESALSDIDRADNLFVKDQMTKQKLEEAKKFFPAVVDKRQKEADAVRADIQDLARTGTERRLMNVDYDAGAKALKKAQDLITIDQLTSSGPKIFGKILPRTEESRQDAIAKARGMDLALKNANPGVLFARENRYMYPFGFASGGLANLTNTIPPESGPMSQGLRSLYNNGRKL
jgi:hypothetical protein